MKKIFYLIFLAGSILFFSGISRADFFATQRHVFDNGLTVLITSMPGSSMVSVYGLVKTGSATEGEYLGAGLSHFMEHMLFKGTERRGVGEIAHEVQSLGGAINAGTHFDYTIYTITVPAQHLEQAADILSDMLMHPRFDEDEIEKERDVVFNEIRMYHDQPDRYLSKRVFQTVYQVHPYRIPIIGVEDLLRPLKRDDFLAYYQKHYRPNNMVVSVAGGVSPDDALAAVKKFFEPYPMGPYTLRILPDEPRQFGERFHTDYYATDILRMSVNYAGVDVLSADTPALDALAAILGEGRGSRLYVSLVDKQKLAHAVSASNFTPKDPGLFEILISSDQDQVSDILKSVDQQIDLIIRKGVQQRELDKAVNLSLKSLFEGLQSSGEIAYRTAIDEAVAGRYDFTQWYVEALKQVTSRDIQRVAKTYLRPERRSVVVLTPQHWPSDHQAVVTQQQDVVIKRIVLDNGLTVLLEEDHSLPMVWMNMVFQAGTHEESPLLNGLSQLTASLWSKGSPRYPYQKMAGLLEQRGVSFSGFSGQNSFGLQLNSLSQDINFCFGLMADSVLNPLFSEETFTDEKNRQQIAIIHQHDDIRYIGTLTLREALFGDHPLGRPQMGTVNTVKNIARKDAVAFYKRYAVPSNAVLSIAGDFSVDDVVAQVKHYFGSWAGDPVVLSDAVLVPVASGIQKTVYAAKKQAGVFYGVQAENFFHEDRYPLEVLGAVIGAPFNGRMFQIIREQKGLSYTLGGGYAPARSSGEMVFQVLTSADQVDAVRQAFQDIVRDIQVHGVTDEELNDVKAFLTGRFERSWELRGNRSFRVALDELYGIGYLDHQQYVSRIQAVTPEQIQDLAQRYFDPKRAVFVTILPKTEGPSADEPSIQEGMLK